MSLGNPHDDLGNTKNKAEQREDRRCGPKNSVPGVRPQCRFSDLLCLLLSLLSRGFPLPIQPFPPSPNLSRGFFPHQLKATFSTDMLLKHTITECLSKVCCTLAAVTQWIEHWPEPKGRRLDFSQGRCLGRGPGPQLGACERQSVGVSLTH